MNMSSLLGLKLKSDTIIDFLEQYDIEVIYEFDRLHENSEDIYWAGSKPDGFLLRFDENQILKTVFLYLEADEGYRKFSAKVDDFLVFGSFDEAEKHFKRESIRYTASQGLMGTELYKLWIKAEYPTFYCHYEFKKGKVRLVTLMRKIA